MKQTDILFGLDGDEILTCHSVKEVIERVMDEAGQRVGEPFDEVADRVNWPIHVVEFRRADLSGMVNDVAERVVEEAYEMLGEEYDDPYGDPQEPTDAVKEAAKAFAAVVIAEFVPWTCEPTGLTRVVSRAEAKRMLDDTKTEPPTP